MNNNKDNIIINIEVKKVVDYYRNKISVLEEQVMQQRLSNEFLLSHINQLTPEELHKIGLHRESEQNGQNITGK